TSYSDPTFFRPPSPATDTRPQIRLAVRATSGKEDEAVLYFEQGATRSFDRSFDAAKPLLSGGGYPTLWSEVGPESFAINGLPLTDLTSGLVIPLGVRVPQDGQYVLTASQLLNLPAGTPVWLEDRQLGVVRNLAVDSLYHFSMLAASTTPRFYLNVGRGAPTATAPDFGSVRLGVYPNPAQDDLMVHLEALPTEVHALRATLTDVLGHEVLAESIPVSIGTAEARLDLSRLPQGVYTLRLTTPTRATSWTRKVVVSR
ncbi:MAG TPA: T9SS type A sorting domain-containing protein, partial [bacterium]|nr:T9SS type A sorting domain-containing protein [bacterium]